jgi:hypothetical protein
MSDYRKTPLVFFHVGLGKAASTYLQYEFFPKLEGIHYIQRTRYKKSPQIIRQTEEERYLISREFDQQLEEECRWFSAFHPEARVIIIFRRHDGWIASQYRRYLKNGGHRSFKEFFDIDEDKGLWKQTDLAFFPKISIVEQYFPHSPPLVLFHEDLKKEPFAFFDKLARFCGATYDRKAISLNPVHRSYSEKQLKAIRRVSSYLFSDNPSFAKNKVWHWIQRRSRLLACYAILYPAALLPESWFNTEPLIPPAELKKIRAAYEDDWQQVRVYAVRNNLV